MRSYSTPSKRSCSNSTKTSRVSKWLEANRPSKAERETRLVAWSAPLPLVALGAMAMTAVEIDSDLLARLRERSPGKSDRELLEDLAVVTLGFETIHRVQRRTAEAGVDQEEVEREAVLAAREHRRRGAAGQAARPRSERAGL